MWRRGSIIPIAQKKKNAGWTNWETMSLCTVCIFLQFHHIMTYLSLLSLLLLPLPFTTSPLLHFIPSQSSGMEYPYFGTPLELPGAVYSYDPSIQVQPLRHERKGRKHGLSDRKMQALQEMKDRHKRENQLYRQDMGIDPRLTQTPGE